MKPRTTVYAHSIPGRPTSAWEPLGDHLEAVAGTAAAFANWFGWSEVARIAGRLHDIGKTSPTFQAYIRGQVARGGDHATAGAREARRLYPPLPDQVRKRYPDIRHVLAFIIAGHHAGLADGVRLEDRLDPGKTTIPPYAGWEAHAGALAPLAALRPNAPLVTSRASGFQGAFLIRMLLSCLVDADRLETERFYAGIEGRPVARGGGTPLAMLRDRLRRFMAVTMAVTAVEAASRAAGDEAKRLNGLRAEVLERATGRAGDRPGLFTLTVPTGGGKTLASLSFALEHAATHGLRRVVYVIPFTSIIEQTAGVFREALAAAPGEPNLDDILEHHASFDWDRAARTAEAGGRGSDPVDRLQRAAENWDVPVVVTTVVQFFESLFANRTARCRKLHNFELTLRVQMPSLAL